MKRIIFGLLVLFVSASALQSQTKTGEIFHLTINGVINPIKVRYIENSFRQASDENARLIIISVNTPGGLVESMDKIVSTIVNSPVPVVTFVEPQTAMATSAGTFIVIAGDVAAMVPGTTIGSAHPVGGQGEKIEGPMEEKVLNVLVSKARALADQRNRNIKFAEEAVRTSQNLTAEAAKETKVIEILARDITDLIGQLDGYYINHKNRQDTIVTAGASIRELPMSATEGFLDAIANPTIAYLLMTLGVMGLIYEFGSPGIGLGAIVGSICLLLGLLSLSALPIHLGGILLLVLGLIMLVLEFKIQSGGLLTVGGIISLLLGTFVLVDAGKYYGATQEIKFGVVIPLVLAFGAVTMFAIRLTIRALRSPQKMGAEGMAGATGTAKTDLAPDGMVFVDGALWEASIADGVTAHIKKDDPIEVVALLGSQLKVKPGGL